MDFIRKSFSVLTVIATVVYTVGFTAFVPTADAAVQSGSLIKASGAAVYYLGGDGKRYVFPDEKTYKTWYADFSTVMTITDAELAAIPIGGNVTYRPGVKLVKIATDPKVYAVDAHGTLRWITSEAVAADLYGANWASMVQDVPDAFFVNYSMGADINTAADYDPAAATAAATSINVDKQIGSDAGNTLPSGSVTVSLAADTPAAQTVPTGASVEVLKFNLKAGSTKAAISSLKLTAGGLGDSLNIDNATLYVDGVKVGTSKNFNSDREAVFTFATPLEIPANASKTVAVRVTFKGAGFYSVGITSAADVTAGGSVMGAFPINGNTMQATSAVTIGEVTLDNNGNTNPSGIDVNAKFGEDDVLLADLKLSPVGEDVLFTAATFENGGTNSPELLSNIRLIIDGDQVATGTINGKQVSFALNNFLMKDGQDYIVEVRGDIGIGNDGDTVKLYIKNRADFSFIGQKYGYGAQLKDGLTDFNEIDTAAEASHVAVSTGTFTIDMDKAATPAKEVKPDTNNVVLATFSMTSHGEDATVNDIVDGGTADTQFQIIGTGIDTGEVENVELYDLSTNSIYSLSIVDDTSGTIDLNLDDEDIPLVKGVKKTFQIRADIKASADQGDTYQVIIDSGAMTVTGDVSNSSITDTNITPSSVDSSVTTVRTASLELTTVALTNTSIVPGAQDVQIFSGLLKAGDADGVKLSSVKLSAYDGSGTIFADDNISQLQLYLNGVLLKEISNQIIEANPIGTVTFNSLSTVNNANVVPAGQTVEIKVVARFNSSFAATGTFVTAIAASTDVVARAASDNQTVTMTGTVPVTLNNIIVDQAGESRAVALASAGNLSVELKTTGANANRDTLTRAGATTAAGEYLAEVVFTTVNEPVKVTDLRFDMDGAATATGADLAFVHLVDGSGNVVASDVVDSNGNAYFENVNLIFDADKATSLYLAVQTKGINVNGDPASTATDGKTVIYNIASSNGVEAEGVNTAQTISMSEDAGGTFDLGEWSANTVDSKQTTIVAAKVTSIQNAMSDGTLTGGNDKVIAKFTVNADTGGNRKKTDNTNIQAQLDAISLTVSAGSATTLSDVKMYIEGSPANTAASSCASNVCTWNAAALANLVDGGAFSGAITLVVTADVALAASDQYLQLSIADLSAGNFSYRSTDGNVITTITNTLLPYLTVSGATLSN